MGKVSRGNAVHEKGSLRTCSEPTHALRRLSMCREPTGHLDALVETSCVVGPAS